MKDAIQSLMPKGVERTLRRPPIASQTRQVLANNACIAQAQNAIIVCMNNAQRKTLAAVFADPVEGNLEWRRIEALLKAAGCVAIEGAGSAVTFEKDGKRAHFHRPHPGKAALRYRVVQAREFLTLIGITP